MKLTLKIIQDSNPQAPNEWDDDACMLIANHRQCFIPPSPKDRRFDMQDEIDKRKDTHWIFPLEAYIHSGVVLALAGEGNFPDRQWDVSRLGVVFCSKKGWRLSKQARKAAESKVAEWNQYLSGDVWGYAVEDESGETLDSCWGFYGHDYCKSEGESMLKFHQERQDVTDRETAMAECCP
jgi:hypothetical protein